MFCTFIGLKMTLASQWNTIIL